MTTRVLLGNSVYEYAEITVDAGRVYIEFEDPELDDITFSLADLPEPPESVYTA